jgi:hypothetical protein
MRSPWVDTLPVEIPDEAFATIQPSLRDPLPGLTLGLAVGVFVEPRVGVAEGLDDGASDVT